MGGIQATTQPHPGFCAEVPVGQMAQGTPAVAHPPPPQFRGGRRGKGEVKPPNSVQHATQGQGSADNILYVMILYYIISYHIMSYCILLALCSLYKDYAVLYFIPFYHVILCYPSLYYIIIYLASSAGNAGKSERTRQAEPSVTAGRLPVPQTSAVKAKRLG